MKGRTLTFMKNGTISTTLAAAIAALAVTGCYNPNGTPNNTGTGVLAGGAFGAATGAIIGAAAHNPGLGAAIGAGSGMALGGLIGAQADAQQSMRLQQQAPTTYARATTGAPLSVADVTAMSKAPVNDDTIIAQIINSHTVYHLSATDIISLHDNGVSERVIQYMQDTPNTISPAATSVEVAAAPPPPPSEPMPPMPSPGYVWAGGEWVWNGGWYWSAGYWAVPPYPGAIWIGGYWGRGPHGWVRNGGHWGRR